MGTLRVFYVTQGGLQVHGLDGKCDDDSLRFPDSDAGFRRFDEYLASSADTSSIVLVDVIEEVFARDTIPKLGRRDRAALLERRAKRKFPRTPYRIAALGDRVGDTGEYSVAYSAISNHELLDPWLAAIARFQVPLQGIFSVPQLAPTLVKKFGCKSQPLLFVTQHHGNNLRQSFIKDGLVQSARLSVSPAVNDGNYAGFVCTEILRSRRYLERSRLLDSNEQMHICMVADTATADQIVGIADGNSPMQFHFVDPTKAKKRLHMPTDSPSDQLESMYVAAALRSRPKLSYASSHDQRYWHMNRLRRAIIGSAIACAAACSVAAGAYLGDAWRLYSEAASIDAQVAQLSETFRRENESFGPIKADSYEMKLAVDTGDFILQQRVPVPWVLQQMGIALADYNDIQIIEVAWSTETDVVAEPPRARPGEAPQPIAIPAINAVSAEVLATIDPFDGDLRAAFARIDRLAADISARTPFSEVAAVEYPVDANTNVSLSGDLGDERDVAAAQFRLRLHFPLTSDPVVTGGANDESI